MFSSLILIWPDKNQAVTVKKIIKEKYIGAWESVNDIRVQAGEEKFNLIMSRIKEKISGLDVIKVPYKNTAWTAQRID